VKWKLRKDLSLRLQFFPFSTTILGTNVPTSTVRAESLQNTTARGSTDKNTPGQLTNAMYNKHTVIIYTVVVEATVWGQPHPPTPATAIPGRGALRAPAGRPKSS
jgi:hypothetical protein